MATISIIGPGRLGGALALALEAADWTVESIVYRSDPSRALLIRDAMNKSSPQLIAAERLSTLSADTVVIATGDSEIMGVAANLSGILRPGSVVLHTSGSLSSDILRSLSASSVGLGSIHPLISISEPIAGSAAFNGAFFCIEGDTAAITVADAIARSLGGQPFSIETRFKPLYHAAAVTASGHLVTVIDAAIEMLRACNIDEATAKNLLMPLVASTVNNLRVQSTADALTGTFARADADAFERHMAAMTSAISRNAVEIYLAIAERSVRIAECHGVDKEKASFVRERISIAKRNLG